MPKRRYEWAVVEYEGNPYDVCVGMEVEEVEEVRPVDSEIDITPVMRLEVIGWMLDRAMQDIRWHEDQAHFIDMNAKERKIEGY